MNAPSVTFSHVCASVLCALVLVLGTGQARAGAIEQLRDFSKATRSARGEFAQRTLKANGQQAEASSGSFSFAKPGKFRWQVRQPFEQLMVADGQKLYFFDKDLNQVTVRKLDDALGATPAAILFGDADLSESFELKDTGNKDGVDWVEARPKNKEAGFEMIAIGMRDGRPEAMEVLDAFGRRTQFTFNRIERNPKLDSGDFSFVTPKGVEVVQQ